NESLRERLRKAGGYFSPKLNSEFLAEVKRIDLISDDKAVLKRARQHLQNLEQEVLIKHACFLACQTGFSASAYTRAKTNAELDLREGKDVRSTAAEVPKDTPHPDLYTRLLEWRSVMAEERNLAVSTIEGHLAYFIARRELDISEFLTKEQVEEISRFFEERNTDSLADAKAHFGERFLYGQLRMVLEHLKTKAV